MNNVKQIISPVSDRPLPPNTTDEEARKLGRYIYNKPTIENSIVVFIDYQTASPDVYSQTSIESFVPKTVRFGRVAQAAKLPVLFAVSGSDLLPELRSIFPTEPVYRRSGIINPYEDLTFRSALETMITRTGRSHILISGAFLTTSVTLPVLAMLQDGYRVYPVLDTCGSEDNSEFQTSILRMTHAGAEMVTLRSIALELIADRKNPLTNDILKALYAD